MPSWAYEARSSREAIEQGGLLGLLHEADDPPLGIGLHDAQRLGGAPAHRDGGDGEVGLRLDVLLQNSPEIHPVELVAAQDQGVIEVRAAEVDQVLPHRVRGSLVPRGVGMALLRRQDLHKAWGEVVELERSVDVPVERGGEELGQQVDPPHAGVDAVGDGDVHQPVLARQGYGGLGALAGEGKEAGPLATPHDDVRTRLGSAA